MSYGQAPFNTDYSPNTLSLVNVGSEETENADELITFIKGTSGNGKRLYVDTNLKYNPSTGRLTLTKINVNEDIDLAGTIFFRDDPTLPFPTDMAASCLNGQVIFAPTGSVFPATDGSVSIGRTGKILLSGTQNGLGLLDRSTGDIYDINADGGIFNIQANYSTIFEISTAGNAGLYGTGAGMRFFERSATPTNYYSLFTSASGSVFNLTYNGTSIATIGTTGITTLVPQKIQNTLSAGAVAQFLTFIPLSATTTAGQVISTNASLTFVPSTGLLTTTIIKPTNINDTGSSTGTTGQYLTKAVGGILWATLPTIGNGTLTISAGTYITGSGTFTANQSGNTSITIGTNATSANTASTIVARDAGGDFSAGDITATSIIPTQITDTATLNGTTGQYLTKAAGGILWATLPTIGNGTLTISAGTYITGSGTFTANQTGNTSITIGTNATSANTASTIVARDAGGDFSAGDITATSIIPVNITDTAVLNGTTGQYLTKAAGGILWATLPTYPTVNNGTLTISAGTFITGSGTFTANQSGNTSITIGTNATSANTASTIVARDASGNFSAGTITASLTGSATLIDTTLQTTGTRYLLGVPLSATTASGQVAGTHASLSMDTATGIFTASSGASIGTAKFAGITGYTLNGALNYLGVLSGQTDNNNTLLQLGTSSVQYKSWFIGVRTGTNAAGSLITFTPFGYTDLNGFGALTVNYNGDTTIGGKLVAGSGTSTFGGAITSSGVITGSELSASGGSLYVNGGVAYIYDQTIANFRTYLQTYNGVFYCVRQQISPNATSTIYYATNSLFTIPLQLQVGDNSPFGSGTSAAPNIASFLSSTTTSGSYASIQCGYNGSTYNSWFWLCYRNSASGFGRMEMNCYGVASALFVYSYGDTTQPGNSYAVNHINTSDARLKEHIEDQTFDEAKTIINKLKPKAFCWKDRNGIDADGKIIACPPAEASCKRNWGFIAQEIAEDFDVANNHIGLHNIQPNEEKTQCVDYCQIIAPLVKCVQDLMATVEAQNKRIKFLEEKLNIC